MDRVMDEVHAKFFGSNGQAEAAPSDATSEDVEAMADRARNQGYEVPPVPKGIRSAVELITPEIAQEYKSKMIRNRTPSTKKLDAILDDIEAGRFYCHNQGIGFNANDELIDGGHRIEAIIRSGKPQWMVVTRGIDPQALLTIDRNKPRSLSNYMQMRDLPYANNVPSIGRLVFATETAWEQRSKIISVKGHSTSEMGIWDDVIEERILAEINPDDMTAAILELCEWARKLSDVSMDAPGVPMAPAGAFYYLARVYHSTDAAEEFINQTGLSIGLTLKSPAKALRKRINAMREDSRKNKTSKSSAEYLAYLIIGFNKFVEGETAERLDLPKLGIMPRISKPRK